VIKGAEKIGLRDVSGKTYDANIVRVDAKNDLALLKVDGTFSALPVANSQTVKRGLRVITVGFPNIDIQGKEPKLSDGIVSALSGIQDEPTVFQISVPIQPGNSGGPLVNMEGNVIGIVASKLSALYMRNNKGSNPENVNYAIKSNYLNELIYADEHVRKYMPPTNSRPANDIVELTARMEKSIALVYAVRKSKVVGAKEQSRQCGLVAKERICRKTISTCKKPAEQGDTHAQVMMGICYSGSGDMAGVAQDYSLAMKWFRLAAAQENAADAHDSATAKQIIGSMYALGRGVPQSNEQALFWLHSSAKQGNPGAQYLLGENYGWGLSGLKSDFSTGYMWATLSSMQDSPHKENAVRLLGELARRMTATQIQDAIEKAWQCKQSKYTDCE
jgi:TPR repeat protein